MAATSLCCLYIYSTLYFLFISVYSNYFRTVVPNRVPHGGARGAANFLISMDIWPILTSRGAANQNKVGKHCSQSIFHPNHQKTHRVLYCLTPCYTFRSFGLLNAAKLSINSVHQLYAHSPTIFEHFLIFFTFKATQVDCNLIIN